MLKRQKTPSSSDFFNQLSICWFSFASAPDQTRISVQPAFHSPSGPNYTGLFENPLPTTEPTQPSPLPEAHKDTVLLQPTDREHYVSPHILAILILGYLFPKIKKKSVEKKV